MIGQDENVHVRRQPARLKPIQDAPETGVRLSDRAVGHLGTDARRVLGLVRLRRPYQRHGGRPLGEYVIRKYAYRAVESRGVRERFGLPRAEPRFEPRRQTARQGEVGMNRRAARYVGVRVVDVCVAGRADSDGDVLHAALGENIRQRGREKRLARRAPQLFERGFERREHAGRVEIPRDHDIRRQPVPARLPSRDHARRVHAGNGREHGMMILEEDALIREPRQIGRQLRSNLRGLQPVEHGDENLRHGVTEMACWVFNRFSAAIRGQSYVTTFIVRVLYAANPLPPPTVFGMARGGPCVRPRRPLP